MKQLTLSLLLASSVILFSGCEKQLDTAQKPKIDTTLPKVEDSSIKSISDITAVALEWKSITDARADGYYIYRSNMQQDDMRFKRVASIDNKYTTHFLDKDLYPNVRYSYSIALKSKRGVESAPSKSVTVSTLPNLESVSLIVAVNNLPRQIKIVWRPHQSERIEKYYLEKSNALSSKWERIATIEDRYNVEYIDEELGDNETYFYRLKAVTFDGLISQPSKIVEANTKPLPEHVGSLKATTNLPRKITLAWTESPTKDVVLYNIYRAASATGAYSKISKTPIPNNRFDDYVMEDGKIYFYKITTVDKDTLESEKRYLSPVMGATLSKPAMPILTLAQIQGNKIILNWRAADNRVVSYNIYKVTQDDWISSKEKLIPNVDGLRFEDNDVVRGVKYKYSIQAVDEYGLLSERTIESSLVLPKHTEKIKGMN
ncbi:MAG: hypothetical protein U9Q33_00070 [Campylobacterota bacterium]|nr:hypothetical protein [Campylobacterota bacterium]